MNEEFVMAIFDKDFYDLIQSMGIAYSHSKIGSIEDRVERLEKLVYELCKEIKKMKVVELKEIEQKEREERIALRDKEKKYHLNDAVIIKQELNVDGNVIKNGAKGIIDNILSSSNGIKYVIKLNERDLEIQVSEDCFELL